MIDSKTRAILRSKANTITPSSTIGKGGVSETILNDISDALEAHELIKVSVLKNSEFTAKEIYLMKMRRIVRSRNFLTGIQEG